ncbi:MAG TPA: FIST N-terminal domain-containing protein [Verrucomicrobiae bacterium]|nr:FIST N-terminal domain-containing protein [Verrucomicrobiae bacterium]
MQLAIVFGSTERMDDPRLIQSIHEFYPKAYIFGCSTAAEICGTQVIEEGVTITAIRFEHTQFRTAQVVLDEAREGFAAGERIAQSLPPAIPNPDGSEDPLAHVLVLSDGLNVNGSRFVSGAMRHLPPGVTLTGGLAGGGSHVGETLVFRDGVPARDTIAAVGLYGRRLTVGFGSLGGWDSFGPERLITRSSGNVLYELDGQPALALYKRYLGDQARGLPGTGLYFPLSIRSTPNGNAVVRSFLAVDEATQSLTFTADIPGGAYARLMKANIDRLIDGAAHAAQTSRDAPGTEPDLAILFSCIGRKLVLKQRVEEEVDAVREVLGPRAVMTGFYSHGEISPFAPGQKCELHNQTMSITTLTER